MSDNLFSALFLSRTLCVCVLQWDSRSESTVMHANGSVLACCIIRYIVCVQCGRGISVCVCVCMYVLANWVITFPLDGCNSPMFVLQISSLLFSSLLFSSLLFSSLLFSSLLFSSLLFSSLLFSSLLFSSLLFSQRSFLRWGFELSPTPLFKAPCLINRVFMYGFELKTKDWKREIGIEER